jgi:putative SOS response-associated peptidase YedK
MCGRYSLEFDEGFYKRFKLSNKLSFETNYNSAPGQLLPVIVSHSPNTMEFMKWGLIPFWEEKNQKPKGLINIRQDTITTKKWAHKYVQNQRCLVPVSGFYEWKRDNLGKHPYYFYLKDKKYYSFAGVYSETKDPNNDALIKSYSIITTGANEVMNPIHDRLPVILKEKDEEGWLNHNMVEMDQINKFLNPYDGEDMEKFPVSEKINNISFNEKPSAGFTVEQKTLL